MRFITVFIPALVIAGLASAASISFSSGPTTDTGQLLCQNQLGFSCDTTAFFESSSLDTLNQGVIAPDFVQAFANWNAQYGGGIWTLNYGGPLSGMFDTTMATAEYDNGSSRPSASAGGVFMEVDVSDIDFPTLGPNESFVWVQGLYDNFVVGTNGLKTPVYELDVNDPSCNVNLSDPAYPCDSGLTFFDRPQTGFQNFGTQQAFFDANTYLAIEDTSNPTNPTLTVLDGVCYGFQNNVSDGNSPLPALTPGTNICSAQSADSPEPDVSTLCVSGIIAILLIGRKKWAGL
jgi:hypothetical protein